MLGAWGVVIAGIIEHARASAGATARRKHTKEDTLTTQVYEDEIVAQGGNASAGQAENLLTVEGSFICKIANLVPFMGTKYQSTEPQQKIRFVYETIDHPENNGWVGYQVDEPVTFTANMANDVATLHKRYKAATGVTPVAGGNYPLKRDLIDKVVRVEVGLKVSDKTGMSWPKVNNVLPFRAAPPPPPKKSAPAPRVQATDNIEDDELADT